MNDVAIETKTKLLHDAVAKGKGKNIFCIRLGGLDELFIKMNDGDPDPNLKVLRVNTNTFTGTRVVTLRLEQWDRFSINRTLYGLQAVSMNGVHTIESKDYAAAGNTISQIVDTVDRYKYVKIDLEQNHLHKAANQLISDVVGVNNLVMENHNLHIMYLSFSNRLRLNQGSQYSGIVYEITNPGQGRVLSIQELADLRNQLQQADHMLPDGKVYLKVPTKTTEMVLCGHENALAKYSNGFANSANYLLHGIPSLEDGKVLYTILPNIEI